MCQCRVANQTAQPCLWGSQFPALLPAAPGDWPGLGSRASQGVGRALPKPSSLAHAACLSPVLECHEARWLAVTLPPHQTGLFQAIKLKELSCCSGPWGCCPTEPGAGEWGERGGWAWPPIPCLLHPSLQGRLSPEATEVLKVLMVYCGVPSPAICQHTLIPVLSKVWPPFSSPHF